MTDADDFVVISLRRRLVPAGGAAPAEALRGFLAAYAAALAETGGAMVGHVKGMLEDGGPSPLFFNLTSPRSGPRFRGGPLRSGSTLILSANVIVAGIGKDEAAEKLERSLAGFFLARPESQGGVSPRHG